MVDAKAMSSLIRKGAESTGARPAEYGTHSLRSGGATALFDAGAEDNLIKQQGRWKSDCFQVYTRIDATSCSRIAASMIYTAL